MSSWFVFKKNTPQEIIAIAIGTASVSTALARMDGGEFIDIVSVLRYPLSLFSDSAHIDKQKRMLYVLKNALAKVFADMHRLSSSDSMIRISFSDPFFEEREQKNIIHRNDPTKPITREEIDAILKSTKNWIAADIFNHTEPQPALANVRREVVELRVNGYPVQEAIGYHGNTLEVRARELAISQTLNNCILEHKEQFYPHNILEYYSDSDILKRAIVAKKIIPMPILAIAIGGEVTTLFILRDSTITQRCAPVFLGFRTLERRIATFLKIDTTHAETILQQYIDGLLDDTMLSGKIETILSGFLEDWYAGISVSLKNAGIRHEIAKIVVVGSERTMHSFIEYLNVYMKEFSENESTIPVELFSAATDSFLPEKSLLRKEDIILALLLLYGG